MTILDTSWRSNSKMCIGFVLMKNDANEVTCRCGAVGGQDEEVDSQFIAMNGVKMNRDEAIAIFSDGDNNSKEILTNWKK